MALGGLRQVPDGYRMFLQLAHWASFALVVAALGSGNTPFISLGFGVIVAGWTIGFCLYGIVARPSPALTGITRKLFRPMHFVLMLLLAATAVSLMRAEPGPLAGTARILCLLALGGGLLHGCFHLWRHTALGDGAMRNIMPRMTHNIL